MVGDVNTKDLSATALPNPATPARRKGGWERGVAANGGIHPTGGVADTGLLHRARLTAVPATQGGGLHPNREIWVREPRQAERSGFKLSNMHRPQADKVF